MPTDRCPTCDRDGCGGARLLAEHRRAMAAGDHDAANVTLTEWAALGCRAVDWRARALAAESELAGASAAICDVTATIRGALAGHGEGMRAPYHGPLAAAVRYPSIVADLRRLDEVLTIGSPRAAAMRDRISASDAVAAELADDLATAQAEIDRAVAGLAVASMLPSMSRLRHGATPTVRVWLGRLVEKLRGGDVDSNAAKDRDDARSWRNAIEGAKEPGDPVLRAIAELLSCTYLDAVPTPADDDIRRELAVAARIANDERRAKLGEGLTTPSVRRDAAKWRRVEPLIERLREAATVARHDYATEDDTTVDHRVTGHELIDAVSELIAAVKEPS